jgi:hypothetical protein
MLVPMSDDLEKEMMEVDNMPLELVRKVRAFIRKFRESLAPSWQNKTETKLSDDDPDLQAAIALSLNL